MCILELNKLQKIALKSLTYGKKAQLELFQLVSF